MLFVRIDVAKSKHDCYIIDSDGTIYTDSLSIAKSIERFESLYDTIISMLDSKDAIILQIICILKVSSPYLKSISYQSFLQGSHSQVN